jgi:hypothetical protein
MAKLKSGTRIYGTATVDSGLTVSAGGINATGIVTATSFSGSGTNLTGIVTSITAGTNITISGSTGNVTIDAAGGGGGGSGTFDTGITTSVYISAISGLGTNVTQNNDVFVGPGVAGTAFGIGLSFPSTAGSKYVIESIHVTNTYSNELYLTSRQDFYVSGTTWTAVPMTQRLVVPYQGSVEIINQPMIANPQDHLRFQAMSGVGATATGIDGGLDVFAVYSTKTDTNFVGVGSTVASISGAEVYRSTTYPSVVQSIRLCNYNLNIDVDASVSIYRGGTAGNVVNTGVRLGYLIYNMTIPKNSVIEILEKPKYLAINDTIVAVGSTINSISACVSAKKITS